jgi:hypothetical protein
MNAGTVGAPGDFCMPNRALAQVEYARTATKK